MSSTSRHRRSSGNAGGVEAQSWASYGQQHSLNLKIPPLGTLVLIREG